MSTTFEISVSTYVERRAVLAESLPESSVALVHSGMVKSRNHDVHYPFRVDSHFWYLTGFDEPNAMLAIVKRAGEVICTLFVAPKSLEKERWEGKRLGVEGAQSFRCDRTLAVDCLANECIELCKGMQSVWTPFEQRHLSRMLHKLMNKTGRNVHMPPAWYDIAPLIGQMRWKKSTQEVEILRHVSTINSLACIQAMRQCHPGCYEYQLAAAHHFESMQHGAIHLAYPSIVAGGMNACVLHYTRNSQQLRDGDLVLVDAGCEYNYYASDITRTFPINGKFSSVQLDLYTLVLEAQHHAIEACVVGATLDDVHQAAIRTLTSGLLDLGVLKGTLDQCLEQKSIAEYNMHGTSHWLGLDVHDDCPYTSTIKGSKNNEKSPIRLENNVVLTVEPGLYFDSPNAPEFVRGMGIRIEDDVCVHEQSPEILTIATPKLPDDLYEIIGCETGRRVDKSTT